MRLIGFTGRKRAGKDTAAGVFLAHGYQLVKFADGLKYMLHILLEMQGVGEQVVTGMLDGDLKEVPTEFLSGRTPRHAMQTLGTEWGRELMAPDFWLNIFRRTASQHQMVVCSDVRFPNEVELIHQMGGKVYRIERAGATVDTHVSEALIDSLEVDGTLTNNGGCASCFQSQVEVMFSSSFGAVQ